MFRNELHFQLQENVAVIINQMENKMKLDMHQQAMAVSFMLKQFQRHGIFANCDNVVYHLQGNTVSEILFLYYH